MRYLLSSIFFLQESLRSQGGRDSSSREQARQMEKRNAEVKPDHDDESSGKVDSKEKEDRREKPKENSRREDRQRKEEKSDKRDQRRDEGSRREDRGNKRGDRRGRGRDERSRDERGTADGKDIVTNSNSRAGSQTSRGASNANRGREFVRGGGGNTRRRGAGSAPSYPTRGASYPSRGSRSGTSRGQRSGRHGGRDAADSRRRTHGEDSDVSLDEPSGTASESSSHDKANHMAGEPVKNVWGEPPGHQAPPPVKSAWGPAPQKQDQTQQSKNGLGDPLRETPKSVWGEPPQRDPKDQANKELLNKTTPATSTTSTARQTHPPPLINPGDPLKITNPWNKLPPPLKKEDKTTNNSGLSMSKDKASMPGVGDPTGITGEDTKKQNDHLDSKTNPAANSSRLSQNQNQSQSGRNPQGYGSRDGSTRRGRGNT